MPVREAESRKRMRAYIPQTAQTSCFPFFYESIYDRKGSCFMPRRDLRRADQLRQVRIERGYQRYPAGSALIEMGHTRVVCSAVVEERVPFFLKGTGTGWVTAEYAMLPAAHSLARRQAGRTQEMQRLIGRALRAVVDLRALGERTIHIDCDVVQADGGTRTASITGAFVALVEACATFYTKRGIFPVRAYASASVRRIRRCSIFAMRRMHTRWSI